MQSANKLLLAANSASYIIFTMEAPRDSHTNVASRRTEKAFGQGGASLHSPIVRPKFRL